METADYCRELESYLCRKNDGHLIRIVGPSFDLVSAWAERGVPVKVACRGIDRYFEEAYYAKGPRRRPVRIDFCEADVLDVFDEWRRATGVTAFDDARADAGAEEPARRGPSLPAHLERVLRRLTSARVNGTIDGRFDEVLDHVAQELETARTTVRGVRGEARQAIVERLSALDRELIRHARESLDEARWAVVVHDAEEELSGFRAGMQPDAFARAREAAIDRLVRDGAGLPTIAFV